MPRVLHGALGLPDVDNRFITDVGLELVWDAADRIIEQHNQDVQDATRVFVQEQTTNYTERFMLPGSGYLDLIGENGRPGAIKGGGSWDVAYPIYEYGKEISASRLALAKMKLQVFDNHLATIRQSDANTYVKEIFKALFRNAAKPFKDPTGATSNLTIQPLANADGTLFPIGIDEEADLQSFLASGYAASAISDINNPLIPIVTELEKRFGTVTGGSGIIVFVNPAQAPKLTDLDDLVPETDRFIQVGDQVSRTLGQPQNLPTRARILGRGYGAWVVVWDRIPPDYLVGVHPDQPAPLKERIEDAPGILPGLQQVAVEEHFPKTTAIYTHRFGFGVGNRMNGVIMQLRASGSYAVPAVYA